MSLKADSAQQKRVVFLVKMAQTILDTVSGASTGTLLVTEPLNFWAGKRVQPREGKNAEPVFEPATGNGHVKVCFLLVSAFILVLFTTYVW
uniref:Uncharacterized protein n=1 Tax=Fundulus heteroclitus TaxID=8078 RepID=A0A3Q2TAV9_FUNHE